MIGFDQLPEHLPHGQEMIFLDLVDSIDEEQQEIVARQLVSGRLPELRSHFPGNSSYPATYTLQAFLQAALILERVTCMRPPGVDRSLVIGTRMRVFSQVGPGEVLIHTAQCNEWRGNLVRISGSVRSGDRLVMRAEIRLAQVTDREWHLDRQVR